MVPLTPLEWLARHQADPFDAELARDLLLRRASERVMSRDDRDIDESRPLHHFDLLCTRQSTGNSTRP